MKKMNLLVMSLVSAAALSFSSCSSDDDLGGGTKSSQSQVDGFYMTLAIQTPTSNGTRTVGDNKKNASTEEQTVKEGTFFLVDQNNQVVFKQKVGGDGQTWNGATETENGTTTLRIKVDKVVAGTTYKVYFLAGSTDLGKDASGNDINPTTATITATEKFASPFANANNFAMFNQNDNSVDGNGYTVVFNNDNKDEKNPASVKYTRNGTTTEKAPIAIERITARIDAPTSTEETTIAEYEGEVTPAVKEAMEDARMKVKNIVLNKYAIANLTQKANVMQTWTPAWALTIPGQDGMWQPTSAFGQSTDASDTNVKIYADGGFTTVTETPTNYVFENNSTSDPTKMYFEYKVTLNDNMYGDGISDFPKEDGTFYRYNNIIFTSFEQIFKQYKDVTGIFGTNADNTFKDAATMKAELKAIIDMPEGEAKEKALEKFRKDNDIQVFKNGLTYYKKEIVDYNILTTGMPLIQRNTVYQVNVKNIFNIGVQVPNGEDETDKKSLFYLDVTVSVNPWVLNTQDVNLQ